MATNITNSSTGQSGYAVPGQALPSGWVASPSQVSQAVGGAIGAGGTIMGGTSSGQQANPKDIVGNAANPLVVPTTAPTTTTNPFVGSQTAAAGPATPTAPSTTPPATDTNTPPVKPPLSTPPTTDTTNTNTGSLKDKYTQAQNALANSGVPSPSTPGSANAGINTAIASQPPPPQQQPTTTPQVDNFFNPQSNPTLQQSTQDLINFLSPPAVQKDLADAMGKLSGDQTLLSSEKLQLMNMQNVMAGTPDDIRDEVTKANGFASESQVQAMAVGRNKVLLKQASFLQQQMQFQQDLVQNDTSLLNFEKDMANTQFTQRLGILNYQQTAQTNMTNAARTSLKAVTDAVGYDGLYKSVANDPTQMARDEQILGLAPGGLAKLAATPNLANVKDQLQIQGLKLDNQKKAQDLAGDGTGSSTVLNPYLKTSFDGTQYADLSSLTPSDKVKYAQVAQKSGVTPILDAGTAGKINAISVSKENLQNIESSVSNILNDSSIGAVQGGSNSLKSLLGNADIKAFSAWRTAVINNVQALAGGQGSGLRINQAEIDTALKNDLPVITGTGTDTLAQAKAKITNLNSQLDTWTKQILGGGNTAKGVTQATQSGTPKLLTPTEIPSGYYQASDGLLYKK